MTKYETEFGKVFISKLKELPKDGYNVTPEDKKRHSPDSFYINIDVGRRVTLKKVVYNKDGSIRPYEIKPKEGNNIKIIIQDVHTAYDALLTARAHVEKVKEETQVNMCPDDVLKAMDKVLKMGFSEVEDIENSYII
jgi:hypothetical protein